MGIFECLGKIAVLTIFMISLTWLGAKAQRNCGTVDYQLLKSGESTMQFENWLQQKSRESSSSLPFGTKRKKAIVYTIPVVVHVVHNGEPLGVGGNITDAQIISQIEVLNQDFRRSNPDAGETMPEFQSLAADIEIEFALARRTPEGLPTNGIVRVQGTRTSWALATDAQLKSLSYWPAQDYMNIWVTNLSNDFLGWAQFPVSDLPGLEGSPENPLTDGVVMGYQYFGSIDLGNFDLEAPYNKGRTTTHEVGHFLGLRHIWGDGGCGVDDFVEDTPLDGNSTAGCPSSVPNSCGSADMYQNYMDYTNDACMNLFTEGQKLRMRAVLENSPRRISLLTSQALIPPDSGNFEDLAIESILSPSPRSCNPSPLLRFQVANLGTEIVETYNITWRINQGEEFSIQVENQAMQSGERRIVEIVLDELSLGDQRLTVAVSDPNESTDVFLSNNQKNFDFAIDDLVEEIPTRERFEDLSQSQWRIANSEGQAWETYNFSENNTLSISADNINPGSRDWLISPTLDFSQALQASLFFDVAAAHREGGTQVLQVLASTDCGNSFDRILFNESTGDFASTTSNIPWFPEEISDFTTEYVNLNALAGEPEVRLAFVAIHGGGNNMFLDNVELFISSDPNPLQITSKVSNAYPNPSTSGQFELTFNLDEKENVNVLIYDRMGRFMGEFSYPGTLNQTYELDLSNVPNGLYIIKAVGNSFNESLRFINYGAR